VNLRLKEYWTKAAPIFVIFSDSNKQENLPARLTQELKINWKSYSKKIDITPKIKQSKNNDLFL